MVHATRAELIDAFTAAWEAKDLDGVMELMAPDCIFRASVGPEPGVSYVGWDAVRDGFSHYLKETDEPAPEIEHAPTLVSDDFAVTRWTVRWPEGDGGGLEVRACDVFEFEGDRIRVKDTFRKVIGPPPGA